MANILKMERQILVQQLLKLGWSYRRIEKETGIRRETISKYDPNHPRYQHASKAAKVPADSPTDNNDIVAEKRPKCPPASHPIQQTRISQAAAYDKVIRAKLELGLSAQRIYQDLVVDFHFPHSYDCVKRYVKKIVNKSPKLFGRIHTLPGEEAQVDFGKGAPTLRNGRYVRPWFFKMVLSYSRHSYEECVWSQDVETFIRCHENAFREFGGVPAVIRLDNLKSGVLKAHLYEPELNPLYAAFANHCGFAPLPCLPRKPEHKGKTESGIGYTKNNALKGLRFDSLAAQNAHLRNWNNRWARTRIHGTTKKQVWSVFVNEERKKLKPLPSKLFQFFKIGMRKVHYDGHIEVGRAYYSVPHRFIGEKLSIHYNAAWIKIYWKNQLIAFHRTASPGRFQTNKKHFPDHLSLDANQYKFRLLTHCSKVGPHCKSWANKVIKERDQLGFRAVQGVLHLQKQYSKQKINWACAQATKIGSIRYHTVKLMCEDHEPDDKENKAQLNLLQQHDIIRGSEEYQHFLESMQKSIVKKLT